jgi:Uma2 family endonuclease
MKPQALARDDRHTWTDYRTWPEDERWEIIDGVAYDMSPAPSTRHQAVTGKIFSRLERQLSGKRCTPFIAPTDVRLSETDVVQPDILVVCDPAKITASHIEGAPDLAVEVLSPSTSPKDLREKKRLYQRAGVREYLVVDPLELYVQRFSLAAENRYGEPDIFGPREVLSVTVLEGVDIALWEIFDVEPPESVDQIDS